MSSKHKAQPGEDPRPGGQVVRMTPHGEERFTPHPRPTTIADMYAHPKEEPPDVPRRADGSIAPFDQLSQEQLEALKQETAHNVRHDGWTLQRQRDFIGRLASCASVTDAARYVGMSRQSARDLYNRAPAFRAAWEQALMAGATSVLRETAFDRAVNGVQEQVWYKGQMVGFREKYNDRLLMFLLRVRDPLNFAPLNDLRG